MSHFLSMMTVVEPFIEMQLLLQANCFPRSFFCISGLSYGQEKPFPWRYEGFIQQATKTYGLMTHTIGEKNFFFRNFNLNRDFRVKTVLILMNPSLIAQVGWILMGQ